MACMATRTNMLYDNSQRWGVLQPANRVAKLRLTTLDITLWPQQHAISA